MPIPQNGQTHLNNSLAVAIRGVNNAFWDIAKRH